MGVQCKLCLCPLRKQAEQMKLDGASCNAIAGWLGQHGYKLDRKSVWRHCEDHVEPASPDQLVEPAPIAASLPGRAGESERMRLPPLDPMAAEEALRVELGITPDMPRSEQLAILLEQAILEQGFGVVTKQRRHREGLTATSPESDIKSWLALVRLAAIITNDSKYKMSEASTPIDVRAVLAAGGKIKPAEMSMREMLNAI